MADTLVKKPKGGLTGRRALNRTGNKRDGMSYSLGIDSKGRVVHIYKDGERIIMHKHAAHAAPPHPSSFGGMAAPDDSASALASLQAATHRPHPADDAQIQHARQLALQAALAQFNGA